MSDRAQREFPFSRKGEILTLPRVAANVDAQDNRLPKHVADRNQTPCPLTVHMASHLLGIRGASRLS